MRNLKKILMLLTVVLIISCDEDDGDTGPQGLTGLNGVDGSNGVDGTDGNANVQTYIFNNPTWTSFVSVMTLNMDGIITQDTIDNDAILIYVKVNDGSMNLIPGLAYKNAISRYYRAELQDIGTIRIISYSQDNTIITDPDDTWNLDWVKVVVIESSNTTTTEGNGGGRNTNTQNILEILENKQIDINDYYAVSKYFKIEQK